MCGNRAEEVERHALAIFTGQTPGSSDNHRLAQGRFPKRRGQVYFQSMNRCAGAVRGPDADRLMQLKVLVPWISERDPVWALAAVSLKTVVIAGLQALFRSIRSALDSRCSLRHRRYIASPDPAC